MFFWRAYVHEEVEVKQMVHGQMEVPSSDTCYLYFNCWRNETPERNRRTDPFVLAINRETFSLIFMS